MKFGLGLAASVGAGLLLAAGSANATPHVNWTLQTRQQFGALHRGDAGAPLGAPAPSTSGPRQDSVPGCAFGDPLSHLASAFTNKGGPVL
jgi:hypothetical protein